MSPCRIAYITESAANNKHAWSGTAHYVYKALNDYGHSVSALGPARPGLIRWLFAGANKLSVLFLKKRIDYRHSILYSKEFGRIFSKKLQGTPHDLVVVCGSTECGAYLKSTKPIVYILDRTIGGALDYHTILSGLWTWSKRQSVFTDKKAMQESSLLFFSSKWAAKHAEELYGIEKNKIRVLAFGANMDQLPLEPINTVKNDALSWKLLLVGTYWHNKGADIAYNAFLILLDKGLKAELTVVGCEAPAGLHHPSLKVIPFVDKNSEEGQRSMAALFASHDVFILPTRFDCTPIVFCEASAFSLPVLSADTGGVAGHVEEGVNGHLLSYEDTGAAYAERIISWSQNLGVYNDLRRTSRHLYETKLNWRHWATEFSKEIRSLF